ncbi:hypothetical protein AVEN_108042-1 [Araneus ventricosus]|uniref:Uncharacterized protein n=1 Tax=Araneus ventricosus TaxID=182803 RepID=A0A4Y1ZV39_ARAVE|nr:hypothetical protein AVEN_23816-1 [Araneus ventricosus]GBL69622.1 hypothetical protein AVEN_108042-1 [Araneus ventricosus]
MRGEWLDGVSASVHSRYSPRHAPHRPQSTSSNLERLEVCQATCLGNKALWWMSSSRCSLRVNAFDVCQVACRGNKALWWMSSSRCSLRVNAFEVDGIWHFLLSSKLCAVDDPRRSAELYQVHEPVYLKKSEVSRGLEIRSCWEKPQACKNIIRCGLFCSTFWADLKILRIIKKCQTSDMPRPTKEASKSCLVCSQLIDSHLVENPDTSDAPVE